MEQYSWSTRFIDCQACWQHLFSAYQVHLINEDIPFKLKCWILKIRYWVLQNECNQTSRSLSNLNNHFFFDFLHILLNI